MKVAKLLAVAFLLAVTTAHTLAQDKIVLLTKDTLRVHITENADDAVKFKYPNETLTTSVSKTKIQKILFESGRIEICNHIKDIPKVTGRNDWEKVLVTFEPQDVVGLTECGKVTGKSGVGGVMSVQGGENAMKDMKKDAAEMGAGIILITSGWHKEKDKPVSGYGRGVKLGGIAYK